MIQLTDSATGKPAYFEAYRITAIVPRRNHTKIGMGEGFFGSVKWFKVREDSEQIAALKAAAEVEKKEDHEHD